MTLSKSVSNSGFSTDYNSAVWYYFNCGANAFKCHTLHDFILSCTYDFLRFRKFSLADKTIRCSKNLQKMGALFRGCAMHARWFFCGESCHWYSSCIKPTVLLSHAWVVIFKQMRPGIVVMLLKRQNKEELTQLFHLLETRRFLLEMSTYFHSHFELQTVKTLSYTI